MSGIRVIAITIIPIPPSHWSIALQRRIALGVEFKLVIIVEPVVVIPDMLSKNESVILKFKSEKINGSDPNIATLIQDNAVNKKACCKLSFLSWSRLDNKNNVPNIIVIKDALINDEFNSSNIICIIIGNIMEIPSMICKIPSVKKTVL
jgi:hypothetical protein